MQSTSTFDDIAGYIKNDYAYRKELFGKIGLWRKIFGIKVMCELIGTTDEYTAVSIKYENEDCGRILILQKKEGSVIDSFYIPACKENIKLCRKRFGFLKAQLVSNVH